MKSNINIADLKFKPSGLLNNACNAPNCPFFLKVTNEVNLKRHLDGWVGRMPMGFHKFVAKNLELSKEAIFEKLCKDCHFSVDLYKVTKEFTLNYIEKVINYYMQLPKEEMSELLERIAQSEKLQKKPKPPKPAVEKKGGKGKGKGRVGHKGNKKGNNRGIKRGRGGGN